MKIEEQPTENKIKELIDKLPSGINPIERIILCHDGTVQKLLSVLFGVQVKVEILSQYEIKDLGIIRWIKLVAVCPEKDHIVTCLAESLIPFKNNTPEFIAAIQEKRLGIGQILKLASLKQDRHVFGLYADDNVIARNYRISGDVEIIITETFPREAIKKASMMIEKNYDTIDVGKTVAGSS